jgi:RND family efflux transporter MFP subunit
VIDEKDQTPPTPEGRGEDSANAPRFPARRIAFWAGAAIVALALLAAPLGIHPLDRWIHGLLGHPEATGKTESKSGAPAAESRRPGERKILFYRNPMNPDITSPVPAKDDMGMDYVPVYADQAQPKAEGGTVAVSPAAVQNMNVTTVVAERHDVTRQIRTVGILDYDQEKMVSVTTKYSGYIEKAFVNYLGQPVRKGQPLFEIYSPELVQTEQELISALGYVQRMSKASTEARGRASDLVAAARTRLGYWDITSRQIEKLEQTGEVFRTLTLVAPASGIVMKRMEGLEGMAVKPGMELLHIANISTLWLNVQVYEDQFPWLNIGSPATIRITYFPGETFTGRVRYIEPQVSEKTRTVSLTLEVRNPDERLRAGMYATVDFAPVIAKDALTVPAQAVIRTGERNVVVVALGEGHFEARDVQLGSQGNGLVQIKSGLQPGQRVVTSAQFFIDSESNLQAAIQKMVAANQAGK